MVVGLGRFELLIIQTAKLFSVFGRELLKPNSSVALHKHSNALVDVLPPEADSSITMLSAGKKLCSWSLKEYICSS